MPRSTARGWLKRSRTDVVSIDVLDMQAEALQQEVLALRRRVTRLLALLHLVVVTLKVTEFSFDRIRIPEARRGLCLVGPVLTATGIGVCMDLPAADVPDEAEAIVDGGSVNVSVDTSAQGADAAAVAIVRPVGSS